MNITELKYITRVAALGSISKAAKELFVSQPNMSKTIKKLEQEYGVVLFERSPKGMVPTIDGQQFIAQAQRILNEIGRLENSFSTGNRDNVGLKLAIPRASYASRAFVEYIQSVEVSESIKVHIKECNSLEALDHVASHSYHLALLRYELENEQYYQSMIALKGLDCENIMRFQYRLLCSRDSPLVQNPPRSRQALRGFIELLHGDRRLLGSEYADVPDGSGPSKRIHVYERGSQFALLQNVPSTYMWVSPMPAQTLEQYGLVELRCPWQRVWMQDVLVYPSRYTLQHESLDFIAALKRQVQAVSGA